MDVARECLSAVKRVRNRQALFAKNMMGVLDENLAKTILTTLLVPEEFLNYNGTTDVHAFPTYYMDTVAVTVNGRLIDVSDTVEALLSRDTSLLNSGGATLIVYQVGTGYRVINGATSSVLLSYYKVPRGTDPTGTPVVNPPLWASATISGGDEIFDPSTSIDFELPEQAERLIAYRIAQYLGINLRDSDVYQFGASEEAKGTSETKIEGA